CAFNCTARIVASRSTGSVTSAVSPIHRRSAGAGLLRSAVSARCCPATPTPGRNRTSTSPGTYSRCRSLATIIASARSGVRSILYGGVQLSACALIDRLDATINKDAPAAKAVAAIAADGRLTFMAPPARNLYLRDRFVRRAAAVAHTGRCQLARL